MEHICTYCTRTFSCKTALDKHKFQSCIWLHKTRKEKLGEIDDFEPKMSDSQQDMMIRQLFYQISKQNKKIETMQKEISYLKQRQKINILRSINSQGKKPNSQLIRYINNIPISQIHLEIVFAKTLNDGIIQIIHDAIEASLLMNECLPLCSFTQKPKSLYIYDIDDQWRLCDVDKFRRMCILLSAKFFDKFIEWQQENQEYIYSSTDSQEKTALFTQKIMDDSYKKAGFINLLMEKICKQVQTTFHQIEYEET